MFNRTSIRVHFPASYVRWPEGMSKLLGVYNFMMPHDERIYIFLAECRFCPFVWWKLITTISWSPTRTILWGIFSTLRWQALRKSCHCRAVVLYIMLFATPGGLGGGRLPIQQGYTWLKKVASGCGFDSFNMLQCWHSFNIGLRVTRTFKIFQVETG